MGIERYEPDEHIEATRALYGVLVTANEVAERSDRLALLAGVVAVAAATICSAFTDESWMWVISIVVSAVAGGLIGVTWATRHSRRKQFANLKDAYTDLELAHMAEDGTE
jgi:general stress protein CsbA